MKRNASKAAAFILIAAAGIASAAASAGIKTTNLSDALYPPDWVPKESPERVIGLYAYASLINPAVEELERAKQVCARNQRALTVEGSASDLSDGDQFWLYRTEATTIVFNQRYVARVDYQKCSAVLTRERRVTSGASSEPWPYPFNTGSMLGVKGAKAWKETIAGLSARCLGLGDPVVRSECHSNERGLSRGMLLSRHAQADGVENTSLVIKIVDDHAAIDPTVFESNVSWKTSP